MKYNPAERVIGAFLIFFAALGPASAAPASAPSVPVVHVAPQARLPLNDILRGEWDITLGTLADGTRYEPLIPYVNVYNSQAVNTLYAAHLKHTENSLNGVTVNAVLTDPAGTVHTYPCWYGEDLSGPLDGDQSPTGYTGWHLTYPCKISGAWTGHLQVIDAGGTVSSATFSFTVSGTLAIPDAAKGRLSIAPDAKYLRYDDGDAYLPLGESANGGGAPRFAPDLAAASVSHARTLIRTWQSRFGGEFAVTGGADYNTDAGTDHGLTAEDAHSGRFSYMVHGSGGDLGGSAANLTIIFPKPANTSQAVSVWVKDVGASAGCTVGMGQYGGFPGFATSVDVSGADIHDGAWHRITGTLGASPGNDTPVALNVNNNTQGYFLFDDLVIVDSSHASTLSNGPGSAWDLLGGSGSYELHNTLDQNGCAGLATALDQCRLADANTLIEFYSSTDRVQGDFNTDGTVKNALVNVTGPDPNAQMGNYPAGPASATDDGTETAGGLFHAQQVRAWIARFGAYVGQGIAYVAFANETPITGGGGAAEIGPEHWAVQMRSVTPDVQPLCGLDTYFNSAGSEWYDNLYESPWLQFAEPHIAVAALNGDTAAYNIPYNQTPNSLLRPGITRHATGGPLGMGYLEFAAGATADDGAQMPDLMVPQTGLYTFSYYVQTGPDSSGAAFVKGSGDVGIKLQDMAGQRPFQNPFSGAPGGNASSGGADYSPVFGIPVGGSSAWQKVTVTFPLTGGVDYQAISLKPKYAQASGVVRYSDITLTDPQGRVVWQLKFDEPLLDGGAGDALSIWGEPFDTDVNGDSAAARPVIIGESEAYGPVNNTTAGVTTSSVAYPMDQYAMRQAAAMVDSRWHADTLWYEDSNVVDAGGYGKYFQIMQSLMDGFFVPDGSWREMPTGQSGFAGSGEPFVVYGQGNSRDAATGAALDAMKAILSILPLQPDPTIPHAFLPGTGLVDVQGLADAPYTVQEYDAVSGRLMVTLTATSASHHLSLNINNLATGLVVKISPVSAPNLTLQLTVDHATAKQGDIVTYTLTYTNTGTGPALGVTVPWSVPAHMQFLSAAGGTYDRTTNKVNWSLGTLAPGASGSVTLKARVQ